MDGMHLLPIDDWWALAAIAPLAGGKVCRNRPGNAVTSSVDVFFNAEDAESPPTDADFCVILRELCALCVEIISFPEASILKLAENTDPLDKNNYCFSLAATETDIFSTTNALSAKAFFGTNVVQYEANVTNASWSVDFGHITTTEGEKAAIEFWDDINGNGERDESEAFTWRTFSTSAHDMCVTNTLAYGMFDRNKNDLPDWWESVTGLAEVSEPHGRFADTDGDGLCNLYEYWAGTEPLVPDGSNTLLSVLCRSIDERIVGLSPTNTLDIYTDYYANATNLVFQRNPSCWASDLDFSCLSVWNSSAEHNSRAGILISPSVVLFAKHWRLNTSDKIFFADANLNVYQRTISATQTQIEDDIWVAMLDEPITNIAPICLLSGELSRYIRTGLYIPAIVVDQDRRATVAELSGFVGEEDLSMWPTRCYLQVPENASRKDFYAPTRYGDSGCPTFLAVGDMLVLVGKRWQKTAYDVGIDSNISKCIDKIRSFINLHDPGNTLRVLNLHDYQQLKGTGKWLIK
ncbi:MAG: hypothetical protein IJ802_02360 [Kiritimatiellae bacterium]|nr:hypothetical protein [Kiritimatiellia bacterium]